MQNMHRNIAKSCAISLEYYKLIPSNELIEYIPCVWILFLMEDFMPQATNTAKFSIHQVNFRMFITCLTRNQADKILWVFLCWKWDERENLTILTFHFSQKKLKWSIQQESLIQDKNLCIVSIWSNARGEQMYEWKF